MTLARHMTSNRSKIAPDFAEKFVSNSESSSMWVLIRVINEKSC
jgi:hypothetical protein